MKPTGVVLDADDAVDQASDGRGDSAGKSGLHLREEAGESRASFGRLGLLLWEGDDVCDSNLARRHVEPNDQCVGVAARTGMRESSELSENDNVAMSHDLSAGVEVAKENNVARKANHSPGAKCATKSQHAAISVKGVAPWTGARGVFVGDFFRVDPDVRRDGD